MLVDINSYQFDLQQVQGAQVVEQGFSHDFVHAHETGNDRHADTRIAIRDMEGQRRLDQRLTSTGSVHLHHTSNPHPQKHAQVLHTHHTHTHTHTVSIHTHISTPKQTPAAPQTAAATPNPGTSHTLWSRRRPCSSST
jgi:hypothetical protein